MGSVEEVFTQRGPTTARGVVAHRNRQCLPLTDHHHQPPTTHETGPRSTGCGEGAIGSAKSVSCELQPDPEVGLFQLAESQAESVDLVVMNASGEGCQLFNERGIPRCSDHAEAADVRL